MRRIIIALVSGLLLVSALNGCRQSDDVKKIVCDTKNAVEVNPFDSESFEEVVLTPSPLATPVHVKIPGDGSAYFNAGDTLYRYSLQDGRKELVIGRRGRAQDEYIRLWEYWIDGEDICLYDLDTHKILRYSRDGIFRDAKPASEGENPFQAMVRLDADRWIGRMTYRGVKGETIELGLFDNDYQLIHPIGEETLLSGMRIGYPFCKNEEGTLFVGPLKDKIWQVTENDRYVKYRVEFTDGTPNLDNYKDEFEMINDIAKELENKDFSYSITCLSEAGKYLGFSYLSSRKKAMYALHDMQADKTYCINIKMPEGWQLTNSALQGDTAYFFGFGDDEGMIIWKVKLEALVAMAGK